MSIICRGLGSVEDIMIDKANGRAIYAVMSFGGSFAVLSVGGFLGMGTRYVVVSYSPPGVQVQQLSESWGNTGRPVLPRRACKVNSRAALISSGQLIVRTC
jgi:PRC-barrel domain